jgi:hypothetical protein
VSATSRGAWSSTPPGACRRLEARLGRPRGPARRRRLRAAALEHDARERRGARHRLTGENEPARVRPRSTSSARSIRRPPPSARGRSAPRGPFLDGGETDELRLIAPLLPAGARRPPRARASTRLMRCALTWSAQGRRRRPAQRACGV